MLAFRRLLARKVPALRFCSSDYNWKDFEALSSEDQIEEIEKREDHRMLALRRLLAHNFKDFKALSFEDQIEEIYEREGHLSTMISICRSAISKKSEALQEVFLEARKAPFKSKDPDVDIMLEAFEEWEDLRDVPEIDAPGTQDETKIMNVVETWEILKNGFEEYYVPMRDVEDDLRLLATVKIRQARVKDAKKQLQNDEK